MADKTTIKTKDNLTQVRFHYYTIKFTPYNKNGSQSSNDILKKILQYIADELHNGKGHLIDRYHNRPDEDSRELFMDHSVYILSDNRIRCSIALLRAGKVPMLKPKDKFQLIPLDSTLGSIVEQTHFFIDYSRNPAIICLEFNNYGPRISDIEYYLRNVANDTLKIAKATEATVFMDRSIEKTLADLKNVLNIEMKIQPQKIPILDTDFTGQYLTGISNLGHRIKPKFFKLEAMFQSPGNTIASTQINKEANNMVTTILKKFQNRPFNIDAFDSFVVKYEDKDGNDEVFNLLKGKKEILKEVDLKTITKVREWYELIKPDFDEFIKTV